MTHKYPTHTLDELEALANAATALEGLHKQGVSPSNCPTCTFEIASRTAIPALIARIRELEGEVEVLRKECGP